MGKFVIKTAAKGYKFDLKATNGEIIASSQIYKQIASARNGITSIQTNAPAAEIEDQTCEGFPVIKHPKFQVYKDKAGEFRFRLTAKNGKIIATSEGYKTLASCKKGIASVVKNSDGAKVIEENA